MSEINKTFQQIRKLETEKNSVQFDITSVLKDAVGAKSWKEKDGLWSLISRWYD